MSIPRVVVAGHVTHDRYGQEIVAGGCAYYGARVYRALGLRVTLCTTVGEDFECDDELGGIGRIERRIGRTTVFTNAYPADGPRVQLVEVQAPDVIGPDDDLPPADLLHLAPVMGEVDLAQWKARKGRARLGLSVQGWIKRAADGPDDGVRPVVQSPWTVSVADLAGVDVACLSEEDLLEQGDLLERLCRAIPVVALTRGPRGCDLHVNGRWFHVGTYPARVRDPTGAGDTFAAAFLAGLAEGLDPFHAAPRAAAAASVVIEGQGAQFVERIPEAMPVRARAITVREVRAPEH